MTLLTELLSSPHLRLMFSGHDKAKTRLRAAKIFSEMMHVLLWNVILFVNSDCISIYRLVLVVVNYGIFMSSNNDLIVD